MLSFRTTVLAVAAAFFATARADYYIKPDSVPLSTRQSWCANEKYTCPIICQQFEPRTTLVNDCDPNTLTYGCLCGNNQRPNVSEYTLTLPFFVCQEWGNQCVKACNGDNGCESSCRQDHPCGASDPKRNNATASATTASATASQTDASTIFTDTPGSSSSQSGSSSSSKGGDKGAAAALEVGRSYGLAIVLTGLFAGFALL